MRFTNSPRTAIIVGATGLVGQALLEVLLADMSFKKIIVFTRRPLTIKHLKLQVVEIEFFNFNKEENYFKEAQVVYCCIGTTIKKAGSNEEFRKVEYEIPVQLAKTASKCGVRTFVVISSLGANLNSNNFYLKTKGEMERDVANSKFIKLAFVRPSFLLGEKNEFRFVDRLSQFSAALFSPLLIGPFRKYRPIHHLVVAKAMVQISNSASSETIYESYDLNRLVKSVSNYTIFLIFLCKCLIIN